MNKTTFYLSLLLINISFSVFSQISTGGTPYSFQTEVEALKVPTLNVENQATLKSLHTDEKNNGIDIASKLIPMHAHLNNSGQWTSLPNGDRLWRLKISSNNARGLYLLYDEFRLAKGAKLFIYNESKREVLGAFTSINNPKSGSFATSYTTGSVTTLELYEPAGAQSKISINKLGHLFHLKSSTEFQTKASGFGTSLPCLDNINCNAGADWQVEKHAVVRILFNFGSVGAWCTGTLMNNTSFDKKPYILTAYHCQENTNVDLDRSIFYFNYETSGCTNPSTEPDKSQSITGAIEKSKWIESDFVLYELKQNIPDSYNPYYAGWDRRNSAASSGVAIHHSSGDIKKISLENGASGGIISIDKLVSAIPFDDKTYLAKHFWSLSFDRGFTMGGASGGSFFNQDKRVVGQLLGGSESNCTEKGRDLYGKLSSSWENGSNGGLKAFLDPENTDVSILDGISFDQVKPDDFSKNVIVRNIYSPLLPCLFNNNTPIKVSVQNYGSTPLSDIPVTLEVTSTTGGSFFFKETQKTSNVPLQKGQTTILEFTVDLSANDNYKIVASAELVNDEETDNNSKIRLYNSVKTSIQASQLKVEEVFGSSDVKLSWTRGNGEGVIVVATSNDLISNQDYPKNGTNYFASNVFGQGSSTNDNSFVVYKGTGSSVLLQGLKFSASYTFAVFEYSCMPESYYIEDLPSISTNITGISDDWQTSINIYPNPVQSMLNINLGSSSYQTGFIQIYDYKGCSLKEVQLKANQQIHTLNVNNLAKGDYILQVTLDEKTIQKRFQIND